ncbi:transcriptional regulator, LuxR family [Variovorax sp. OV700]|nr:transcriptional regulator, LuxR family [Variovorax sp. OV700]
MSISASAAPARSETSGISAQALSDVIGAVYDCALDPLLWPATCRRISDLCESTGGGICVHDLRQMRNDQLFVFGYPPEFLEKLGAQYADSPMAAADVVSNIGDVSALSMAQFHLREGRFFREVLEPFGLQDMMWFPALRTGGRMASLHASRKNVAPRYQEHDVGLFNLLAPHVCRALAISDALDIRALHSEMLEKTLDGLAAGVFLTARDGQVVYMNRAAEQQVRAGTSVRLANNRLAPTDSAARAALSKAIGESTRDGAADSHASEHSVAIPDAVGGGYIATLLPIESGQRRGILAPFAASVAVFVQDPIQAPPMPGEAFARLHKLTGGERRVLLALSQGLGGMEAADMLGISEATVRTHLQHMYSKTGTSRQSDLLRLLSNSAPPLGVH